MVLSAIENLTDIGNDDLKIREYSSCCRRWMEGKTGLLKKVIYKSNFIRTLHFKANLETGLVTAFVS